MASISAVKTANLLAVSKRAKQAPVDDSLFDTLSVIYPNAAGIDIGSEKHYVSVPMNRDPQHVRTFACFTPDIEAMAKWLKECGITHIVMESTGVYWMPSYQILTAAGFNVQLVDARHSKNVPGRKTDVWDARWLRKLHMFGLLDGCFLPPAEVEEMRSYWRHRASLFESSNQQTLRIHKSLEMMNIQLHKVVSDTAGVTGMSIIRAIVAGERDPFTLTQNLRKGLKHSRETFVKALTGNYRPEYLFTLRQALASYDFIATQVVECDEQLKACMAKIADRPPHNGGPSEPGTTPIEPTDDRKRTHPSKNAPKFDILSELVRIAGVDLTRIDGIGIQAFQTIISECGWDLKSRFITENRFCSWLGVSPNNRITGGKVKSSRTRRVNNRVTLALRMSAESLHHSKSALGAYYRRMRTKLGAPKAIVAAAHKLARMVWRLLVYGHDYVDIGQEKYEQQTAERQKNTILRAAAKLGYSVVDKTTGEVYA